MMSGWQDSNLRPPAPKAGAITGLRYTPNSYILTGCKYTFFIHFIYTFLKNNKLFLEIKLETKTSNLAIVNYLIFTCGFLKKKSCCIFKFKFKFYGV